MVIDRKNKDYFACADELTDKLLEFVKLNRRERIDQRNQVEKISHHFDWKTMVRYYKKAYAEALSRLD
jgi:glycogen(starch) synthase